MMLWRRTAIPSARSHTKQPPFQLATKAIIYLPLCEQNAVAVAILDYLRFSGDQIFTHDWPLVGRTTALQEIQQFLTATPSIAVISGRGGSGKTRPLRAVADMAEKDHFHVRSLAMDKNAKPDTYELLPREQKLLILIDDTHERTDIAKIIAGITKVNV